jgi:hypothetical protein
MGLGVPEARSQQMQDPEDVQKPKTEISPTELSDLRQRAEDGDGKAQFLLGRIYMVGLVVTQARELYISEPGTGFQGSVF